MPTSTAPAPAPATAPAPAPATLRLNLTFADAEALAAFKRTATWHAITEVITSDALPGPVGVELSESTETGPPESGEESGGAGRPEGLDFVKMGPGVDVIDERSFANLERIYGILEGHGVELQRSRPDPAFGGRAEGWLRVPREGLHCVTLLLTYAGIPAIVFPPSRGRALFTIRPSIKQ